MHGTSVCSWWLGLRRLSLVAGCGEDDVEPVPLAIVSHPAGKTVLEGENATFAVTATGLGVTYQWLRDSAVIPYATKPTFTVFSASLANDGTEFICIVSDATGSLASAPATLNVNMAPPVIRVQPKGRTVAEGGAVGLVVNAAGSGTLLYQWKRDGVDVAGATNATYTINPVAAADGGPQFTCEVSNAAGPVTSDPAVLTVVFLAITTPGVPGALTGVRYYNHPGAWPFQLLGEGGGTPYAWSVAAGAPPTGITVDGAGIIDGTTSVLGPHNFTVQLEESGTATVTKDFTLTVYEPAIEIDVQAPFTDPSSLRGTTGEPFSATLTATGGTPAYTWSVPLGSLPDGLTLNPSTGEISGTPTVGGGESVFVEVSDSGGRSNRARAYFNLNALRPDMPYLLSTTSVSDGDTVRRAFVTKSASPMSSVTVDALFMNSSYPTRLRAFSPPTHPNFTALLPGLGPGEEIWEFPALEGDNWLGKNILTDSQGRKTVRASGSFQIRTGPGGRGWPVNDADGDGVPDSYDTVPGDDRSDAIEIHRDAAIRTLGQAADVTPPRRQSTDSTTVGLPGAVNTRLIYELEDESFIAGGEAYVFFPGSSPPTTVTVPLSFWCVRQAGLDFMEALPGSEHWMLPYIPVDYEIHGVRCWDSHGNVVEWGMGSVAAYTASTQISPPATDVDTDGMDDDWELKYYALVTDCVPGAHDDADGFTNLEEYYFLTDPTDDTSVPPTADSDGDGVPDRFDPDNPASYMALHQPLPASELTNYDSDGDGMPDIWEGGYALDASSRLDGYLDPDGDGISNLSEFLLGNDPYDTDSDNDGVPDGADDGKGNVPYSSVWWSPPCAYTPLGEPATSYSVWGSWGNVYDGTNSAAPYFGSYYPLAWVKIAVKLYPSGEVVLIDASKVADPSFYSMWWIAGSGEELWTTPPVAEYFQVYGAVACDDHGRVTGH